MMAHELPLQLPPKPKGAKEKPRPRLPNGDTPNFGPAKEKKLPSNTRSGENKPKLRKPKKKAAPPATNATSTSPQQDAARPDDSYAGSLFHLSPEALALPKPLFRSSPQSAASSMPQAPANMASQMQNAPPVTPLQQPTLMGLQTPMHQTPNRPPHMPNLPPAFVYQGMPPAPPPQYPVTSYAAAPYGGFHYSANPQGFINYLYPPAAVPQPPLPMQSYPLGAPMQQAPAHPYVQQGQKITFNDLMGSK